MHHSATVSNFFPQIALAIGVLTSSLWVGDRDISRVVAVGGWQRGCLCVCVGGSA